MGLCYAHRLGNVELINSETEQINQIEAKDIKMVCEEYLLSNKQAVLKYKSKA